MILNSLMEIFDILLKLMIFPSFIVLEKGPLGKFSSVQLFSRVQLFATPWTAAHQASRSITNSNFSIGEEEKEKQNLTLFQLTEL